MPLMKFILTYDGPLPASANKPKKQSVWEIRKQFHPQLAELWETHPALRSVSTAGTFPLDGGMLIQAHHQHPRPLKPPFMQRPRTPEDGEYESLDLNTVIEKHGRQFWPLVRESYDLHCGLKVLFLRKESPGRVYQGGDVDGRIKTLLDALAMPQHLEQVIPDVDAPSPMMCLLEDDSMISSLEVETERLLTADEGKKDWVRLIISVDVRVRMARIYNQSFL